MICCSLAPLSVQEVLNDFLKIGSIADIVEVRLDFIRDLNQEDIQKIISKKKLPIILTCRRKIEGGFFSGDEEKRISILKKCIEFNSDYVDLEFNMDKKLLKKIIHNKKGTKIIISYHNFENTPNNLESIYNEIKKLNPDIIKIACAANLQTDNLKILSLIKKARNENISIIVLCMGEKGEFSRILNLAYGSFLTYGYFNKPTAPSQISCQYLKRVYRSNKLKLEGLKIYGIIGNPLTGSRGYIAHNLAFKEMDMNSVYINFLVDDLKDFVHNFKEIVSGFSVTLPYKTDIMQFLDKIDDTAKKIGAVNTVAIRYGKLIGYNTDMEGAIEAIEEKISIKEKNVVILGAGGAAKAIAYGVLNNKGNLTITNRTEDKGKKLASQLNCNFKKIEDIDWKKVALIINATPVGMMPDIHSTPLNEKYFLGQVVFDVVYNPVTTKFLQQAQKKGCTIISGLDMFVAQAVKQFKLWTGKDIDKEFMRDSILQYVVGE